jgi:hypothetical protein
VRCDLVAGFVGVLESGFLAVDTAVECAGYEECAFCAAGGEGIYELRKCEEGRLG